MSQDARGQEILRAFSKQLVRYESPKHILIAVRSFVLGFHVALDDKVKRQPHSILESRFTPAGEALSQGFISCGAMVNISSFVLHELGFEVRLVHGETAESADHAWLVVVGKDGKAREYDPTRPRLDIPKTHVAKQTVSSWEELRSDIEKDHETLGNRRAEKGIR